MLRPGDIKAWFELTGKQPLPEEIDMILAMDSAYVAGIRKEQKLLQERTRAAAPPPKSKRK